jgi:hypothetical protein
MSKVSKNNNLEKLNGPGRGRPKGSKNVATKAMKDCILGAFEKGGGEDWLVQQMIEEPVAFMSLMKSVLPKDINADIKNHISITQIIRRVIDPSND